MIEDGDEAIAFLLQQGKYHSAIRPDLILLDLHLPKKDGLGVLTEIKSDDRLRHIPVIILTTSDCREDVLNCYQMEANCYLTKPSNLQEFQETVTIIKDFWLRYVKLPL